MSKEECMEALSRHANIQPVITSTVLPDHDLQQTLGKLIHQVWNELEKENKEFFEAYAESQTKQDRMSQEEISQMIQKMISDSSKEPDD
ncbi:uncharacterized protein LOC110824248 [Carica papaya]|uniref:uncharacterized protein LOC110824248 n=1 Tax=Carica papaya TaxID=3649 RepID=UPI000B8C7EF8|nr:uncharacterized protein LOC110824248 [Carica papaya]